MKIKLTMVYIYEIDPLYYSRCMTFDQMLAQDIKSNQEDPCIVAGDCVSDDVSVEVSGELLNK